MIGIFQYLYSWGQWNFSSRYLRLPRLAFPHFSPDALSFFWRLWSILSSSVSFILSDGCFRKEFQWTVPSVSFVQSPFLLSLKPETVSSFFLFPSTPSTVLITSIIFLHIITTVPLPVLLWNLASGLQNFIDKSKWCQVGMKAVILKPGKKYHVILFQGLTQQIKTHRIWDLLFPAYPKFYFRKFFPLLNRSVILFYSLSGCRVATLCQALC